MNVCHLFAMFFRDFSRSFEMTESSMFVIPNVCEGSLLCSASLRFLVATLCRNDNAGVCGFLVIPNVCEGSLSELVTTLEEVDSLQLLTHCSLLFVGHVLEGSAVLAKVKAYEFHDALATDDVAAVVADDIDDLL